MKISTHYIQVISEYKSVILRFILLIFGLLFINFSQAQSGNVCSSPIIITELPFTHSGNNISTYGNDYDGSDVINVVNNPYSDTPLNSDFLNGSDVVYSFTPVVEGFVDISFSTNQLNSSIWVFVDCPFGATVGWDYSLTEYEGEILDLPTYTGETFYFVLSSSNPSANYSFDFEIKTAVPGKKCEVPKEITSLPYNHTSTIYYYGNNYDFSDMPPAAVDAIYDKPYDSSYLNGYEVVYAYTPSASGYLNASVYSNFSGTSINVFTGCPFQTAIGWDHIIIGQYAYVTNIPVVSGQTYYFVVSNSNPLYNYVYSFALEEAEGLVCEAPFQITEFPFTSEGDVPNRNDYNQLDVPPASPNAIYDVPINGNYLRGPEVVFAYTPVVNEFIDASSTATTNNSSLWVFTGCPFQSTIGWDYSPGQESNDINQIPVIAGETYYFVLSGFYPNNMYSYTFNLKKSFGAVCELPLNIQSLPFTHQGILSEYENDYSTADIPPAIANPTAASALYEERMNGYDVVYSYTPDLDQLVSASVIGDANYGGLWVFTGCPFELLHGWDLYTSTGQLEINDIPLQAGVDYYFVVSYMTGSDFDFTFQLTGPLYDCPILEKNIGDPCSDGLSITTGDHVSQDCECVGYFNNASVIFTIPQAATCGDRTFQVRNYVPGSDITINTTALPIYNSNTFTVINMPLGKVDMYIEIDGAFRILLEDQVLTAGTNLIEISELVLGDLNDNNSINITDISLFAASFGTAPNSPNYNALANINCDSSINIIDLSLLGANFGMQGVSLP